MSAPGSSWAPVTILAVDKSDVPTSKERPHKVDGLGGALLVYAFVAMTIAALS